MILIEPMTRQGQCVIPVQGMVGVITKFLCFAQSPGEVGKVIKICAHDLTTHFDDAVYSC